MLLSDKIKSVIRDVPDYPKAGVIFKDITPLLANAEVVDEVVRELASRWKDQNVDVVAAVEARGFIFGALLAHELNCSFVPVRKAGKLPYTTRSKKYELEYGAATIEIHTDAIRPGARVLVHDDLLATGGTSIATGELIKEFGAELIGFSFIVNLSFLPGEKSLEEKFKIKPDFLVSY